MGVHVLPIGACARGKSGSHALIHNHLFCVSGSGVVYAPCGPTYHYFGQLLGVQGQPRRYGNCARVSGHAAAAEVESREWDSRDCPQIRVFVQ